jgi:hypothetical protein
MASVVLKSLPQVVVTTSGTAVVASSTSIDKVVAVFISCPAANTGNIQVGDSTVEAAAATRVGVEVAKSTMLTIQYSGHYIDLANIYVDALNNGDKALISYLQVT